tara:strand:- start:604 stop:1737 length:1134 start_codon:yes stop_codon:yes gene_type:complete
MKNQKICIIGDGLTGLTTATTLRKLNLNIDLFCSKYNESSKKDKRTTAISESSYKFLKENIDLKKNQYFWPCKKIHLFYENQGKYLNFLNYKNKDQNLMYVFENLKFIKHLINELKRYKNVNFVYDAVKEVNYDNSSIKFRGKKIYYDIIILCTGNKSTFYKNIDLGRSFYKDYKEFAITGNIKHNLKINNPSQYFLKEGPLAILPFKRNMFSLVWSISKDFSKKNIKILINNKLKLIFGKKAKIKILKLQSFPLYLNLKTKYFRKNILILGQGIHSIHPIAGQGFNLILRDIKKLSEIIKENLRLGIAVKDSYILKRFYESRNPENTLIGLGNDLVHNFFKKNKLTDPIKPYLLNNIDRYEFLKKASRKISDKGFF